MKRQITLLAAALAVGLSGGLAAAAPTGTPDKKPATTRAAEPKATTTDTVEIATSKAVKETFRQMVKAIKAEDVAKLTPLVAVSRDPEGKEAELYAKHLIALRKLTVATAKKFRIDGSGLEMGMSDKELDAQLAGLEKGEVRLRGKQAWLQLILDAKKYRLWVMDQVQDAWKVHGLPMTGATPAERIANWNGAIKMTDKLAAAVEKGDLKDADEVKMTYTVEWSAVTHDDGKEEAAQPEPQPSRRRGGGQ